MNSVISQHFGVVVLAADGCMPIFVGMKRPEVCIVSYVLVKRWVWNCVSASVV